MWQVAIDTASGQVEIVPVREAGFHANVVTYLQPPFPIGMAIHMNSMDIPTGMFDLNVKLSHPFADPSLTGFDVKGILISRGTAASAYDSSLKFADWDETRLLNADGWTRWWNPVEFYSPGLLGYTPGLLGSKGVSFNCTLHAFKYFADHLSADASFYVKSGSRNKFSATKNCTRRYVIHFPVVGGQPIVQFNYAVDACWESPIGDPQDVNNFPPEANQPEPYQITVEDNGSTAFYDPGTGLNGRDLRIRIGVRDYGGTTNPDGVMGELDKIVLESPTLFSPPIIVDETSLVSQDQDIAVFEVSIPDVTPGDADHQEILVHAICALGTYNQGFSAPAPTKPLAAYMMYEAEIYEGIPKAAAPENVTIRADRNANGKITGFTLDWDDCPEAEQYLVYWSADPYEALGPMTFELAPDGTVTESTYHHDIASSEANGQWMLYVVARGIQGYPSSDSEPSERAFIDIEGFEDLSEYNADMWRIRSYVDMNYSHFVMANQQTFGVDSSGSLILSPSQWFARRSVSYCVTPELPQVDGASSCFFEFAHKRSVNFPCITDTWYSGDYPHGYSICSTPEIDSPEVPLGITIPYLQTWDYRIDVVAKDDFADGNEMNFDYIDGLDYRYNDQATESADPANGWSGLASGFVVSKYAVPKVIDENQGFVGVCFGGKQYGSGYDYSSNPTVFPLICDEFALTLY